MYKRQELEAYFSTSSSIIIIEDYYLQTFFHSLKDYPASEDGYLFINKNGDRLTRSGVRTRINTLVTKAAAYSPSLLEKDITPHTFRHSVAMNLLVSGVDISTIAIWLGHSSIETTHKYMVADIESKRKAMEKQVLLEMIHTDISRPLIYSVF